jgi:hypothetical protein
METDDLQWVKSPGLRSHRGWAEVVTPLGATAHARLRSDAWDVCTEWQLLSSGRGSLSPSDPVGWFGEQLGRIPAGLLAELYAAASRVDEFSRILMGDATARSHILELPAHAFNADREENDRISTYVDLARALQSRLAARNAAAEAVKSDAETEAPPICASHSEVGGSTDPGAGI